MSLIMTNVFLDISCTDMFGGIFFVFLFNVIGSEQCNLYLGHSGTESEVHVCGTEKKIFF